MREHHHSVEVLGLHHCHECPARAAHHAAEARHPQIVIGVLADCPGRSHRDVDIGSEIGELAVLEAAQIDAGHDPQRALVIRVQGRDRRVGQALFDGVGLEMAVAILRQAVGRADPQRRRRWPPPER